MISTENNKIEYRGVASADLISIVNTIKKNNKVKSIILFGSRAKGTYKKGSDIDIAIVADDLSFETLNQIRVDINELNLPYRIDIIDFKKIRNKELTNHINRVGMILSIDELRNHK